ncbi:ESPR domain-containing protein [Actinobacillus suis]|uniref:ESPR domain-containing protein n=1 Tax=Actinobacillus suis TaxID=716 RepID=A0ABT1WT62_ACTSU|nr:ESPR domain-containing protein [Actinobacillus suis]MCQ9629273.1 ESPR domain-containing protein [Actinobacillus suis]MCQ9632323.1 ESPR domain-containing protein [Actinobacillus suis]
MNKHRYKLIFSKMLKCLIPVSENIKSAAGKSPSSVNGEIKANAATISELKSQLSPLSILVNNVLSPTKIVITRAALTALFSQVLLAPFALATPDAIVDPAFQDKTQIKQLDNKTIV